MQRFSDLWFFLTYKINQIENSWIIREIQIIYVKRFLNYVDFWIHMWCDTSSLYLDLSSRLDIKPKRIVSNKK